MLVRERMISPGKRISENLPINTAIEAYHSINSSWLPVVDPEGTLVGLLTPADIQKAKAALKEYYVPFLDVSFAVKDGSEKVWLGKGEDKREPLPLQSCSSGLQSVLPLLMSIEYSLRTRYFDTFAIEEPEQNLFPSNQRELLSHLVSIYNQSETYGMLLTTHSPYTLSCMNVMMLAGKLIGQTPELQEKVKEIVGPYHYVSPQQVSVYKFDPQAEKYCEDMKNPDTELIGINSLDVVSEYIGEDYDRLIEIYLTELRKK